MSKLIIGFLLGVTVTVTAFYMLNNKSDELQERPADQFAVNESSGNEEEGILGKIPEESGDANEGAKDKLIVSTPAQLDSYAEQSDLRTESNRTLQADSTVTSPTPMPAERAPQSDYPPEITDMIENHVSKELQARYEADEREESWATYMEGQLAAYFAQKPELAQFNFSLIDCRSSICEIHALGYGPEALALWNISTADIVTQTWHDFRSMSLNHHNPQPDILVIVLILSRKPSD